MDWISDPCCSGKKTLFCAAFFLLSPSAVYLSSFCDASHCVGRDSQLSEFLPILLVTLELVSAPPLSIFITCFSHPLFCGLRVLTEAPVLQKMLIWLLFTSAVADLLTAFPGAQPRGIQKANNKVWSRSAQWILFAGQRRQSLIQMLP